MKRLQERLQTIIGKGYKAYKQLQGSYQFENFRLTFDHIQGDPYALPSRISISIEEADHGLPQALRSTAIRQIALEDFLARAVSQAIGQYVKGQRGTGHSGQIRIATSGQQVLRRNAVLLDDSGLEARLLLALPADGRSVRVADAQEMLFDELPKIVEQALLYRGQDLTAHFLQVDQVEDQAWLRDWLQEVGGVAFVADNSLLPRRSGVDDRPLVQGVPFHSPASLRCQVVLPHRGGISGMLIPRGVTLIVGGGFHGKSTLLHALEMGVYNHLPADGRELVVTSSKAVKIRAEDHRAIHQVNISPFIGTLPGNRSTVCFSTENASGSTSQAANIIEALESGADCFLIDEDTSATNFMIRDPRMQQLVRPEQEPITPLLYRVRELYEQQGVSSIIVAGGSGDYLAVADRVILMDNYCPRDVSAQAARLAGEAPSLPRPGIAFSRKSRRLLDSARFNTHCADGKHRILVRSMRQIDFGPQQIDLSRVEQLVDVGQTEAVARLLDYAAQRYENHPAGLVGALRQAFEDVEEQGLDILHPWKVGHLAMPRFYELVAAANRLRTEAS